MWDQLNSPPHSLPTKHLGPTTHSSSPYLSIHLQHQYHIRSNSLLPTTTTISKPPYSRLNNTTDFSISASSKRPSDNRVFPMVFPLPFPPRHSTLSHISPPSIPTQLPSDDDSTLVSRLESPRDYYDPNAIL